MAVDAVGGDLPPVGDVLADLVAVAVPLAPLAVVLGRREAHLVLLRGGEGRTGETQEEEGGQRRTGRGYLGHGHLLHGVHHVRGLLPPVALDYVSLY